MGAKGTLVPPGRSRSGESSRHDVGMHPGRHAALLIFLILLSTGLVAPANAAGAVLGDTQHFDVVHHDARMMPFAPCNGVCE